ncbi:InlB B-repeat-containing protein [Bifidobacterium choladohabitans]|uniref:RCC1 domain-containing protein n=1 Tax=Bifidobacterium choladohabitans TaxID=2750947 RepID=UPI002FC86DE6
MKTGTLAAPPQQNPQRPGFRFDGWMLDGQPFDFRTPVLQDTTLKAQWTKTTDWTLNPDHGPAAGARLTISPPSLQEPYYVSVRAAGGQLVGLTGDGRIYTWTQDSPPKQVPFPAQAADGFRYLQAAAGSRRQAALGSDQKIYTWTSRQPAPTILDTSQSTQFSSISINDNLLLAVDQRGQVHAFQDNQDQDPKVTEQATLSLPGQAQAVTASSGSQALIVDADGQAWTSDTTNTGNVQPEHIRQNPGMRIVQAQVLSQGFLLLDADGQPRYLAGSTAIPATVGLPDGVQASRITTSNDQAVITDTDGHIWAWKPGKTPKRADDGSQQYMQAAAAGSRISAISRQGGMLAWSMDAQGNPGKPVRLDTATASILESASLDGHALTLSRSNDAWQAEIPARKPGPAAILITGRQDGQPFARSLAYTVDQPLTRGAGQRSAFTVRFGTGGGSPKPADQHVSAPYGRVKRPSPDPVREGFLFDGWFTGDVAYDFSRPVGKDLTLTAHWTPAGRNSTWSISPNKGSQLGRESTTITPPDSASRGIRFSQVSGSKDFSYGFSLAVGSDGNAYAWGYNTYGQLGDGTTNPRSAPVKVGKPAGAPADFTYLQVSAGYWHSLAVGSDGNAYAWGYNYYGQLGNGTSTDQHTPVRVRTPDRKAYPDLPADFTYVQVSAGYWHSLAVGSDGNAYAWGSNGYGQLGNNTSGSTSSVPVRVRDPDNPTDKSQGLQAAQLSAGGHHSLAVGSDGNAWAWGWNGYGQLGNNSIPTGLYNSKAQSPVPVPVSFNLALAITGVRFDQTPASGLTRGDGSSVTVTTPAHLPGTVTVSVDYTLGGAPQTPDTSLKYTYLPAGVLPKAGGEGILLALATGMTGMGGVLASRRHRQETRRLLHALHE